MGEVKWSIMGSQLSRLPGPLNKRTMEVDIQTVNTRTHTGITHGWTGFPVGTDDIGKL